MGEKSETQGGIQENMWITIKIKTIDAFTTNKWEQRNDNQRKTSAVRETNTKEKTYQESERERKQKRKSTRRTEKRENIWKIWRFSIFSIKKKRSFNKLFALVILDTQ